MTFAAVVAHWRSAAGKGATVDRPVRQQSAHLAHSGEHGRCAVELAVGRQNPKSDRENTLSSRKYAKAWWWMDQG